MCSRYSHENAGGIIRIGLHNKRLFSQKDLGIRLFFHHTNGYAHEALPVVTMEQPETVQLFHWGLIPFWVKDKAAAEKIRNQTLNARAETVFEKPSFRHLLMTKRCLVPAGGFFEWREVQGEKYPYYIQLRGREQFCFAGLYDTWVDKTTGEVWQTFTILTTEANDLMAKVHNLKKRMPVILHSEDEEEWLTTTDRQRVQALMQPYPAEEMTAHTISKLLTTRGVAVDVPEVTTYAEYPQLGKAECRLNVAAG